MGGSRASEQVLESERSRRDFLKLAAAVGLAVPFSGVAGGLGSSAAAASKHRVLGSFFTVSNSYYASVAQGAKAAARALNAEFDINVSNLDLNAQKSAIENAPARGIKGALIAPLGEVEQPELARTAQRNGLEAVINNAQAHYSGTPYDVGSGYIAYHELDGIKAFEKITTGAFKAIGGKGNVLYVTGNKGHSADTHRTIGFNKALKKFPGIKVLEVRSGKWNRVDARPVIDNLLTRYPKVDAIVCSNDEEALAAVAALQESGRKALVTGFDAVPEILDQISAGTVHSTFAQHPVWLGAYSMVRILDVLNGWTPSPLERMMFLGGFVVDTPAAAKKYKEIAYGKKVPYNFRKMSRVLSPKDWDPQNALKPINLAYSWQDLPKPAGYSYPASYTAAWKGGGAAKVTKLYAEHFKRDPLLSVRKLTRDGGKISV